MPGFDGMGPRGMGPMTGGGRGLCSPFGMRAAWRPFGARRRTGYRYASGTTQNRAQELDFLKVQAEALRNELKELEKEIEKISSVKE